MDPARATVQVGADTGLQRSQPGGASRTPRSPGKAGSALRRLEVVPGVGLHNCHRLQSDRQRYARQLGCHPAATRRDSLHRAGRRDRQRGRHRGLPRRSGGVVTKLGDGKQVALAERRGCPNSTVTVNSTAQGRHLHVTASPGRQPAGRGIDTVLAICLRFTSFLAAITSVPACPARPAELPGPGRGCFLGCQVFTCSP